MIGVKHVGKVDQTVKSLYVLIGSSYLERTHEDLTTMCHLRIKYRPASAEKMAWLTRYTPVWEAYSILIRM